MRIDADERAREANQLLSMVGQLLALLVDSLAQHPTHEIQTLVRLIHALAIVQSEQKVPGLDGSAIKALPFPSAEDH